MTPNGGASGGRTIRRAAASTKAFSIDSEGNFNSTFAERFAAIFGLDVVNFEAPNKPSQFALLDHFGREVRLSNVRLEELLRVEIYRRGLHSDAFLRENLRPAPVSRAAAASR